RGVLDRRVTDLAPIPGCPRAHCRLPVSVDGDPDDGRVAAGDLNVEIVGVPALFGKGRPARPPGGHRDRRVIYAVAGAVVFETVDVSDEGYVRVAPAEHVTELIHDRPPQVCAHLRQDPVLGHIRTGDKQGHPQSRRLTVQVV